MKYFSTRGHGPVLFTEALLDGLAPDGGLYLPESYPEITAEKLESFKQKSFKEISVEIMAPFMAPEFTAEDVEKLVDEAYTSFAHEEITPLKKLEDNLYLLELFHGPTLAFKDVALQMLGRIFDKVLSQQKKRATILGATSGDTGPAAIEGVAGLDNLNAFILFPNGRVSDVQRRQMTTVNQPNIFPVALDGSFDDCQDIVKELFNDTAFNKSINATAINSISWARLVPQIIYYFYAWSRLDDVIEEDINFVVPTGNFGDIFAGYAAKRCGLPMGKLVIASNVNDILTRFVTNNDYSKKEVSPTVSPSIDIQIASNFERYLFELFDRDSRRLNEAMGRFKETGVLSVSVAELEKVQKIFSADSVNEAETLGYIRKANEDYGELIDTHTAVGFGAADQLFDLRPAVVLATAHPAKFPDAVEKASGIRPALPPHLSDLLEREEKFDVLPKDASAVKAYILEKIGE